MFKKNIVDMILLLHDTVNCAKRKRDELILKLDVQDSDYCIKNQISIYRDFIRVLENKAALEESFLLDGYDIESLSFNCMYLTIAQLYANIASGCKKVKVGAVITDNNGKIVSFGANRAVPNLCKLEKYGCLRTEKYGEATKDHRNPEDCRAIHSEVDAIIQAGESVQGKAIYVTRYPCEGCAKTVVAAGITKVIYGRDQKISEQTADIFNRYRVHVEQQSWQYDDVTY